MALPELNSNIFPDNEVVTTQVHDGAEIFTQVNDGNSVESLLSQSNPVITTHNVVPQVVTTLKENGQDITTTVEGFWDVVWSVNGQTGDVIIDVVVGNFLPNTTYRKGAAILYNSELYIARETFTTRQEFSQADWTKIEPLSAIAFNEFVPYAHYYANQAIWHVDSAYIAKQEFTAGEEFDEDDWKEISSGKIKTITSADTTVTVTENNGTVDLSIGEALLGKVSVEDGKGLSSNDYSDEDKEKLDGIEDGAERNLANTVVDADYVHTDNNYSDSDKDDVAEIDGIIDKIPVQASSSNQLADKAFVNSSVQTATANFRGNWAKWENVPVNVNLYPVDYAGSKTPTINDYLVIQDASDYTLSTLTGTWRFKYSGVWATDGKNGWHPEYQVNETPMTAVQLAALNSGITTQKVSKLDNLARVASTGSYNDLSNKPTIPAAQIQSDWSQTSTSAKDYIKNKPIDLVHADQSELDPEPESPWVSVSMLVWSGILNKIYPVGSIYMSTTLSTAAQVHNALGGTWQAWGSGRVPVGVDATQTEFDAVEETGGEKTHSLTGLELPGAFWHTGILSGDTIDSMFNPGSNYGIKSNPSKTTGDAHNNLQPYITCYMYKRIA